MIVNGTVQVVTCLQWATQKLSAEDLAKFTAAQTRNLAIWEAQQEAGQVLVTNKTDVVEVEFNNSFVSNDPEYVTFMNQMLADMDVTWPGPGCRPAFY